MSPPAQLPAPRLITTTHTADGTSVFAGDEAIAQFFPFGPQATGFSTFHSSDKVPASNTAPFPQLANMLPRCPPKGVMFGISDFPPGHQAPMHRTLSLDYAIVMTGEIVLRLDGGEEKTVKAGEFIVQSGVNHEWINRGKEICRFAYVMVGSDKITLENGKELEETVFKK
ncbi:hypothetical protein BDZ45DRAFT_811598 [Acephala macrosclerotiorum]|nr:hypothetical protein BDZ45DRAFT_811598 [Acephala macrosclerotiorum]